MGYVMAHLLLVFLGFFQLGEGVGYLFPDLSHLVIVKVYLRKPVTVFLYGADKFAVCLQRFVQSPEYIYESKYQSYQQDCSQNRISLVFANLGRTAHLEPGIGSYKQVTGLFGVVQILNIRFSDSAPESASISS